MTEQRSARSASVDRLTPRARGVSASADQSAAPLSRTVAKAFTIIDLLALQSDRGITLSDLSVQLHMPKSTVHRYLATLQQLGLAERSDADRFRLGTRVIELAGLFLANSDLRTESQAALDALATQTDETIHLAVPSGTEVVYIAKVESKHALRMYSYIGARLPMYCTALGKAILAFGTPERRRDVLAQPLKARTPSTITSRQALERELETVRSQGFAIDDEENEPGIRCVGAPIADYSQTAIAALSVSGPGDRIDRKRCAELAPIVRDAAQRISKRMGYVG
jgi:DNA-binding IclR family transcriptional regulator